MNTKAASVGPPPSERSQKLGLSGIREIFEKAQKIPDVIRLEFGEPDFDTPENIKAAAIRAINEGKTKYTSSAGLPELRRAISSKFARVNALQYDAAKEIVVTAGATNALNLAFLATTDPGDEVLVPDPGWATYSYSVQIVGAIPVPYALRENAGYQFERDAVEKLVSRKTKGILINTPSNPTGAILPRSNLKEVAEFAIEHNLSVYSDEVYEKFLYGTGKDSANEHVSIASLPEMRDRTITINTFSKTYAMTGWRLGYIGAPERISSEISKINATQSSCVSSVAQYAALEALNGPQDSVARMISAFARRREVLANGLNKLPGFSCPMPSGAFYAFPNISGTGSSSYSLAMKVVENAHVAVVPGSSFGNQGEEHLRLAYANSLENIRAALERISRMLQN